VLTSSQLPCLSRDTLPRGEDSKR
ncbi:anaphase-promoting complex, cyclosome, subunit 3 family protein, partial [Vibrio harveyi]